MLFQNFRIYKNEKQAIQKYTFRVLQANVASVFYNVEQTRFQFFK